MAEAQRLRDLHFRTKALDSQQTTPMFNASGESTFNEFTGGSTGLNWFSESEQYAANHGIPRAFYINEPDIFFGSIPAWKSGKTVSDSYIARLKKFGYTDEQISQKVQDINKAANSTSPAAKSVGFGPSNELVTRNNNTAKLVNAVTYDDKGVRIPLGERDNFSTPDIRYSWLPWVLGGTTAATVYNSSTKQ